MLDIILACCSDMLIYVHRRCVIPNTKLLEFFFQSRGELFGSGENVLGERRVSRHRDHDHTCPKPQDAQTPLQQGLHAASQVSGWVRPLHSIRYDECLQNAEESILFCGCSGRQESFYGREFFLKSCMITDSLCCFIPYRQLNKIMAELDLLKSLFDRAGGAKHGSTVVTSSKTRRSAETVSQEADRSTTSSRFSSSSSSSVET